MDNTASFSNRSNAKRAAEKMLLAGTAPAVDYGFKTRADGRFVIVWRTAPEELAEAVTADPASIVGDPPVVEQAVTTDPAAIPSTRDIETEIATASGTADVVGTAHAAETQSEPDPFPAGTYVTVQRGKRKVRVGHISHRIDSDHWRVHMSGAADSVTVLVRAEDLSVRPTEEPTPEAKQPVKRSRRGATSAPQKASRSRYAIDAEGIASGKLPAKAPVVTSAANPHYQKKFDALHAHAAAGEWDAVRDYKVTGSNSYSKMVERYRQDLLAVRKVQETTAAQGAAQ